MSTFDLRNRGTLGANKRSRGGKDPTHAGQLDIDAAVTRARQRFDKLRQPLLSALIVVECSRDAELSDIAVDVVATAFDAVDRALTIRPVAAAGRERAA